MQVAVIVPVLDCPDLLESCYAGLLKTKTNHEVELIFVDNGSGPETIELLQSLAVAGNKVIYNGSNLGFSRAVNIGAEASDPKADIVLYNEDCVNPETDWLDQFIDFSKSHKRAAIQGALLTYPHTRIIQHCWIVFPPGTVGIHAYQATSVDRPEVQESKRVAAVTGAVMFIRRSAWDTLGGFPEVYQLDCEDSHMCLAINELGLEVWYNAKVHVQHFCGAVKKRTPTALEMMRASHDTFMARWDNYLRELPSAYTTFLR